MSLCVQKHVWDGFVNSARCVRRIKILWKLSVRGAPATHLPCPPPCVRPSLCGAMQDKQLRMKRANLRWPLLTGKSRAQPFRDVEEGWLERHWPELLDCNFACPRPGEAGCVADVARMLETGVPCISSVQGAAENAAEPRKLSDAELAAIGRLSAGSVHLLLFLCLLFARSAPSGRRCPLPWPDEFQIPQSRNADAAATGGLR